MRTLVRWVLPDVEHEEGQAESPRGRQPSCRHTEMSARCRRLLVVFSSVEESLRCISFGLGATARQALLPVSRFFPRRD